MRTRGFIVLGVAIVVCALLRSAIRSVSVDGAIKLALSMPAGEILAFRLQSVLSAAMLGAALGLSGLALQSLLRNPLASPFVLGVSSGAVSALLQFSRARTCSHFPPSLSAVKSAAPSRARSSRSPSLPGSVARA